jgi:hypothetical protein
LVLGRGQFQANENLSKSKQAWQAQRAINDRAPALQGRRIGCRLRLQCTLRA